MGQVGLTKLSRQPEVLPQRVTGVFAGVCATLLQKRHDLVDEVVQPVRGQMRHQDEPVAGVGLYVLVDLGRRDGRRCRRTAVGW